MDSAEARHQYRGDLAQTALPEMLNTIHRFQVAGTIEAEREGIVKQVHVKEGCVVHATSTDLNDSLGTFLLRAGKLDPEQYAATMDARERGDRRFGVILIESGLLSPAEVYDAIRQHIEAIVWSLFYWTEGRVSFSIGDPGGSGRVTVQLPMRQVVLQGIKRAPNARELVHRLGRRDTVFEPAFDTEGLIDLALEADEHRLLAMVDGERTLYEICDRGPLSAADNAKLLYAFQVLRLIRQAAVEENEGTGEVPLTAADSPPSEEVPAADAEETVEPAAETPAETGPAGEDAGGEPSGAAGSEADSGSEADGGSDNGAAPEKRAVKIRIKTPGDRFS